MPPLFIPSSEKLMSMIAAAEAKCDGACEQARMREEAHKDARAVRAWEAEAEARRRRRLWGFA